MIRSAEKYSEKLLNEYSIISPPIDIEKIAKNLNINIQYEPFDGELSGLLIIDEKKDITAIGVNSTYPKNRQRFIIAHEIGHYLLHRKHGTYIDTTIKYNLKRDISFKEHYEEVEANMFALSILIPQKMIEDLIENRYSSFDFNDNKEINEIADYFQVTPQTLMIRLAKLNIFN